MAGKMPHWIQQELRRGSQMFARSADMKHGGLCVEKEIIALDIRRKSQQGVEEEEEEEEEGEREEEEEEEAEVSIVSNGGYRTVVQDEIALVALLNGCAMQKDLYKAARIHATIIKIGLLDKNIYIGSTLVNMYAKCGALEKGQHVFDELPVRNVVSWNGLIGGYVQSGNGEKALNCYECMHHEGLAPNAVTFTCILKACSSTGASERGKLIHAEIVRDGLLDRDIMLGNALVDMYAKCGALAKAHQVFEELPARNVISCTTLITGYCQHGCGEEALSCFERMKQEGLSPDAVTFACILKACGGIGTVEKGREIHAEIIRKGLFENHVVLGNALVDMYAKCGALAKAQQVFDELPIRDVVSWNAMIGGYCEQGQGEEALNCFEWMNSEGLSPNEVTFACILKACSCIRAAEKGKEIHAEIMRQGLLGKDNKLGNALLDMYAKCGLLTKARQVFKELQVQDVVSWTSLITGFCLHGHGEDALNCFEELKHEDLFLDAVALACILKACSSIGAANMGIEIHAEMVKRGLLSDGIVLGNALVDMYAKCGALAKAQQVLDELPTRNVMSWNAVILGFCQYGHGERAINCFEHMACEGISPDAVTFACILKACGSVGAAEKGHEIHSEIARKGLLENGTVLGNALLSMYVKCGLPTKAQEVFEELPCRNVVSWNVLITGYCQYERSNEAVSFFDQMQGVGLSPDAVTFACILKACGSIGAIVKGEEIHVDIVRKGFLGNDPMVGSALVDMYAKCGALLKAREVFDKLPTRDVVAWTVLIGGYCEHGHGEEALQNFEQMKHAGHCPDAVTFACILKACGSIGAPDKGQMHFESISRRYGIIPTVEHHTSMVDLLGRAGHFDSAMALIKKVPFSDHLPAWFALLGVCRKWGNVKLGKLAFESQF